jgi:hypothetical protein
MPLQVALAVSLPPPRTTIVNPTDAYGNVSVASMDTDGTYYASNTAPYKYAAAAQSARVVALSPNYTPLAPVVTTTAAASLVLKPAKGSLYSINATNQTTTAGFLVVIDSLTTPTTGATITPLACAALPASGSASINYGQIPESYTTGIIALLTSAATCFTFTSGTITGYMAGLVQ